MEINLNEEWHEVFAGYDFPNADVFNDSDRDYFGDIANPTDTDTEAVQVVDLEGPNHESGAASNVPQVGMVFNSPNEALQFYNAYAYSTGFGVITRSSHRTPNTRQVYNYTFACNKYRQPDVETSDGKPTVKEKKRGILGTHCKASITIRNADLSGSWVISRVYLEHNHEFVPNTVDLITTNREIPFRIKRELQSNDDFGMPINVNIKSVINHAGGVGNCTFTEQDARNYLAAYRKEKLREYGWNDAVAMLEYFEKKKSRDENFYYTYSFTGKGHLTDILWSDGMGRAAYKYFSDVIVVDATYLKNRYDLPVVLIGGCNHHFQTIIFCVALLSEETEAGYTWVFQKFLDCMKGAKPKGILTDQCLSMELGIKNVFGSDTVHRYCSWHILNKLPSKWAGITLMAGLILLNQLSMIHYVYP